MVEIYGRFSTLEERRSVQTPGEEFAPSGLESKSWLRAQADLATAFGRSFFRDGIR
jgi:hypothetical protein